MQKSPKVLAIAATALAISACSGNDGPDGDQVTETRMDDVDVIDGTISDEMVDVDTNQEVDSTGTQDSDKADEKKESASAESESATSEPTE